MAPHTFLYKFDRRPARRSGESLSSAAGGIGRAGLVSRRRGPRVFLLHLANKLTKNAESKTTDAKREEQANPAVEAFEKAKCLSTALFRPSSSCTRPHRRQELLDRLPQQPVSRTETGGSPMMVPRQHFSLSVVRIDSNAVAELYPALNRSAISRKSKSSESKQYENDTALANPPVPISSESLPTPTHCKTGHRLAPPAAAQGRLEERK